MRSGKEDEKAISPMFPRLHVNDTERGGPRAPPRNKMALYEQLSIPSQKHISGSTSTLLLPQKASNSIPSSLPSSHGDEKEKNLLTSICNNSPAFPQLAEKLNSYSSSGAKLGNIIPNEGRSIKETNHQSSNNNNERMIPSTARCIDSFQLNTFSNFKKFSSKKITTLDEPKTLISTQSLYPPSFTTNPFKRDEKQQPKLNSNSMQQQQQHIYQDPSEGSASVLTARIKILTDASSKDKAFKSLKRSYASMNEQSRRGSVDLLRNLDRTHEHLNHTRIYTRDDVVFRDNNILLSSASGLVTENLSMKCFGDHNGVHKDNKNVSSRPDEASEVDSMSQMEMSPDDVAGLIGEKLFWKARSAIVNQQRVFSVQVFELHRVIKVQKLIAGSPNLILDETHYMMEPAMRTPVKKPQTVLDPLPIINRKVHREKPDLTTECADENTIVKLPAPPPPPPPLPPANKGFNTQQSNMRPYNSEDMTSSKQATTNNKQSPWCFPHPGNQWLVPVMSPSEGLVYKPFAGPCPQPAGFMGPLYGNCSPVGLNPGCGEFMNTAFGVPDSHQQGLGIPPMGQTYFPPYGMPVMNPSFSSSAVEQMNPSGNDRCKDNNQLLTTDINFTIPHQSSCNMSNQISRVIPSYVEKLQASKESEIQGSTASSPSERPRGFVLPLFPTEPTPKPLNQTDQNGKPHISVIKVVPHNPSSATQSAARIFRSIQEERKI